MWQLKLISRDWHFSRENKVIQKESRNIINTSIHHHDNIPVCSLTAEIPLQEHQTILSIQVYFNVCKYMGKIFDLHRL